MSRDAARYEEVLVAVSASRRGNQEATTQQDPKLSLGRTRAPTWTCTLRVYTNVPLPQAHSPSVQQLEKSELEVGGLPIRAIEYLDLYWNEDAYRSAFLRSERAAAQLMAPERIFGQPSPVLRSLLHGTPGADRPIRIWWSLATVGLAHLPWEALAGSDVSFVRGLPPNTPIARIPVEESIRVALVHQPDMSPASLVPALLQLPGLEVQSMTGPPLDAIRTAAHERFHALHLIADGSLSLTDEAFLYLLRPDAAGKTRASPGVRALVLRMATAINPILPLPLLEQIAEGLQSQMEIDRLSATKLGRVLLGSRVGVLAVSPEPQRDAATELLSGYLRQQSYAAFAGLGRSPVLLPNVVVQIAPCAERDSSRFWATFYQQLAATMQVERAFAAARHAAPSAPIALYLRQRHRETFELADVPNDVNIGALHAELQQSKTTLAKLRSMPTDDSKVGRVVAEYQTRLTARQEELEATLEPWIEEGEVTR